MDLQVFENSEFGNLGILEIDGELMFPASRCAGVLGYKNTSDAILKHCKSTGIAFCDVPTNGGIQKLKFITEGNLYRLITKSKLPQADRFERWVFDEVIPQIRQTGGYISVNEEESDEEILSRALLIAQKKIDSKKLIIKQQQQLLIEQEDKVQSYNRIVNSNGLFNMREVAQLLNFEIGRNKLYEILRDKKVLNNYNLPYEVQLKAGRFEVKSSLKGGRMVTTTLVTPKGIDYINNLIIKEGRYKQRKAIS